MGNMFREGQQEDKEFVRFDWGTAFAVEGEAAQEARRLSTLIDSRVRTVFHLDREHRPHISLFQGSMTDASASEGQRIARDILTEKKLPHLPMARNLMVRPNGNVWWNLTPSPELRQMHLSLSEKLRPLTEGHVLEQFEKLLEDPNLSSQQREQLLKYGAFSAGEHFLPHITLARLVRPEDWSWVANQKPKPTEFVFSRMVAGKLDEYGQFLEFSDIEDDET